MNMTEPAQFAAQGLRGTLRRDVDMSRHTSWRAGGRAERVYQPADLADLATFLRILPASEPLVAVGLGSNLLVRDGGLRGTVLLLHGALNELRLETDGLISPQGGGGGCTKGTQSTTRQVACGIDSKATDNKVRQSVTSQRLDGIDTVATTTHMLRRNHKMPHPSCGKLWGLFNCYCGSVTNPIRTNPAFAAPDITCATSS